MTELEKDEIYEFWGQINACYGHNANEFEAAIFERMVFDKYPLQEVKAAFEQHVCGASGRASEFAPKPATILALLADTSVADASGALEFVRSEVARVGSHRVPDIDEPVLVATILMMGGWTTVCQEMPDPARAYDYEAYAKRFASAHARAVREVNIKRRRVPPLHARQNERIPNFSGSDTTLSIANRKSESVTSEEPGPKFRVFNDDLSEDNRSYANDRRLLADNESAGL